MQDQETAADTIARDAPIGVSSERKLWPVIISGLAWVVWISFLVAIASNL
ncbi:MAG: hypothetical protein ACYTHJ_02170 [Planctomycetota bacterium]